MWFHVITIIFIIAKLAGAFPYSWWIVFAPSLIGVGLGLAIIAFIFTIGAIATWLDLRR